MNYYVHDMNPILLQIGSVRVAWYGIMYLISFVIAIFFVKRNFQKKAVKLAAEDYENYMFYLLLGVIIGGRLGYILFYGLSHYISNPLNIFKVWEGGMSFHGGMLGCVTAGLLFCRKYKYNFYTLADPAMPFVALGLGFGRIGNFINGELWGKVTTVPWAVIFPNGGYLPRHPSQLYEALLEGFLMAIFLQIVLLKTKLKGLVFWLFIGTYGVVRFLLEFIRVPDENVDIYDSGLIWNAFTMGQVLSLFMIVACLCFFALLFFKYRRAK